MKPKDLRFPFKWEERKPLIHDRVLFIPKFYDKHQEWHFPGWDHEKLFGRSAPIEVEYCSGNGSWIIEKAKCYSGTNWIAVEKRFDRVQKIWSKAKNQHIDNLFIVCGEALVFTEHYVIEESFSSVYINFPDPWPKGRHAKNRLLQEAFITQLARVCTDRAKTIIVTDHEGYADCICKEFVQHSAWTPVFPAPYFVTEWEGYGTSYFEELWRQKEKTIHYLQFSHEKMR